MADLKIMVVDDDKNICELLRLYLEKEGFEVLLAYNGMRGSGHKQLFYWFYPAHVYLLYGVSCLVYRLIA